jgi:osmotically-inducible protein OsmY
MRQTAVSRDHLLEKAITDKLQRSADVSPDRIDVGVTDGTVTLLGQVRSYVEKTAAVDGGLRARGVIAREVTAALRTSTAFAHEAIRATVRDHRVSLVGTVSCLHQRDTADKMVSRLPGVALVVNSFAVTPRTAHGYVVS